MGDRAGLVLGAAFAFCAFMLAAFAAVDFRYPVSAGTLAVFAVLAGIGVCFARHFLLLALCRTDRTDRTGRVPRAPAAGAAEAGEPAVTGQAPRSVTDEGV